MPFGRGRRKGPSGSANKMTKKRFFLGLVLGLVLALALAASAMAAGTLEYKGAAQGNATLSGPGELTFSITVSNAGDEDMPGPVKLYYPDMTPVEDFGAPTLAAGNSKSWEGTWNVTQKELESGFVGFIVERTEKDPETGELTTKMARLKLPVTYAGAEPELSISRSFLPAVAGKNQEVSVIYEISNTGTAEVSNVTIKEHKDIAATAGAIKSIAPGETKKYVFTAKMGTKNLNSEATVTYKAGGKSYTEKVGPDTITYGTMDLTVSLSADKKGGAPGDTVRLKLTMKNSGKNDYTNVRVTDETLGDVFTGETVRAGESVALEKDLIITETTDLQFVVKGDDPNGNTLETATGRVHIIATDPAKQIVLSVEASADRSEVYRIPGGVVRFKITVHNESAVDVRDISVMAVDRQVYHFDSIPSGESRTITRDMEISMAGIFQFNATTKDELNQMLIFPSNQIPIAYAPPTPVPTEAPLVTPPAPAQIALPEATAAPQWIRQAESAADTAKWIFLGIAGVLGALLLIGAVRRGRMKSQSNKAMDHLEGANYRDYSAAPRGRKRNEVISGEEEAAQEAAADAPEKADESAKPEEKSELMAETLKRLYEEPAEGAKEAAETAEAAAEETAEAAKQEIQDKAEPAAQSMQEANRRRRAGRKEK